MPLISLKKKTKTHYFLALCEQSPQSGLIPCNYLIFQIHVQTSFFWKEDNCSILSSCFCSSTNLIGWEKAVKGMFPWHMQSSTTHYCGSWMWGREKDQIIWTTHSHLPTDIFKDGAEITIDNKSLILHLTEPNICQIMRDSFHMEIQQITSCDNCAH